MTRLALLLALAAVAVPRVARADEMKADCEFLEIAAKKGDKPSVDAELAQVEKKLKGQPFAWNQFKFLSRADRSLTKHKAEALPLKVGSATATLVEVVEKSKVRIQFVMTDDKGKTVVDNTTALEAGDSLVFGTPLANGDGHLVAITCK
ncbi:MAG TPA: hypothetical protein VGM88_17135 [Kofleriaceae bacterium]|jgi:hypothetical protein